MNNEIWFKKGSWLRALTLTIVCALFLAACSSGGSTTRTEPSPATGNSGTSPSGSDTSAELTEPLEIDLIAYAQGGFTPVNGSPTQKFLEERFNVKFNVLPVEGSAEKFNLYFAQGGTADVVMNFQAELNNLIDQGLFREIDPNWLYEKMPTWMSKAESLVGSPEMMKRLMSYNGKQYVIPFTHGPLVESGIMFVRQDWMNKVGIAKLPESIDEFEQMLKAFTESDPDGNGQNDTYGMHGGQRYHFNYVWGAYGIMPKTYTYRNGSVTYTSILPEYKEVLKLLNKWYTAGYFDPEFITDDRTMQRNKWSEGKFGILADNTFWSDSVRGEAGVLAMVEAKNPNAEFAFMSPFEGPNGHKGSFVDFPSVTGNGAIFFGKDASDEIVLKMMEIKEALASDWELYKRAYYGEEGKHYTVEANGQIKVSPDMNAEIITNEGIAQTFALMPITFEWMQHTMNERDALTHKMAIEQPRVYSGRDFAVSGTNESLVIKGEDMLKVVDEYYVNAVTGRVDIDATWDSYVQTALNAGLKDILDDYTEMYNAQN